MDAANVLLVVLGMSTTGVECLLGCSCIGGGAVGDRSGGCACILGESVTGVRLSLALSCEIADGCDGGVA